MRNIKTYNQYLNEITNSYDGDYDKIEYKTDDKILKPGDKFKLKNPGKWNNNQEREPRYLGRVNDFIIFDYGRNGITYKTEKENLA